MNLRKYVLAAALGATVLTALPALVAPHEAAADGCWGEYYSDCQWDPGAGYDPGGGGGGDDGSGGGDDGSGGGGDDGGQVVVITGSIDDDPVEPAYPADPEDPSYTSDSSGGNTGSSGGADSIVKFREGPKAKLRQPCINNNSNSVMKLSQTDTYKVSYKVNANVSASAAKALSVSLGAELNTEVSRQLGFEVTINPGQGWTLDVEYQTVEYAVTTTNWLGQSTTDFVNVTQPTGAITGVSCN